MTSPNIYGPGSEREPTDDDPFEPETEDLDADDIADADDAELQDAANHLARRLDDGDEPDEVDGDDDGDGPAEPQEPSWRQESAPADSPPQDFGQLRQQLHQAVAADPDLAAAMQFSQQPYLYEKFARERPAEFIQWQQRAAAKFQQAQQIDEEIVRQAAAAEQAKLADIDPDFAHAERGKAKKATMRKALKGYGFSEDEINKIGDARVVNALNDAVRYRAMAEPAKKRGGRAGLPRSVKRAFDKGDLGSAASLIARII